MNLIDPTLFVRITDINRQITEHEHLILVLKDKTASSSFKNLLCTRQISQNPYPIRILLS